ncbi:class I SAM-dependent methyltransferase [Intrasporangium sp. YIM S08009]|uniref:class I SAM-dependent methyltransferase n=1 Tax=Intrasporangium zincisolvens TaxID=3080018 RepID=UPI002B05FBCE|nr:class I SAM-dependent methyltransferase [Intrasporangium sp. YIM S08009]
MTGHEARLREYYDREMAERDGRPLGEQREGRVAGFAALCTEQGLASVLEVGCGAGRDGRILAAAGLGYTGVDLSRAAVELCRAHGLAAQQASALDLPFDDDVFDAAWTMSTLMHLEGDDIVTALAEVRRVVRRGGLLEVGVWGGDVAREWVDEGGRYFQSRTDAGLLALLAGVGEVTAFDTWSRFDDGGHYQWARVTLA